jgi:hypothetical protein
MSAAVTAQNSIGLRASSFGRNLPFSTAINANLLRNNPDEGLCISYLKKNYLMVVPESVTIPIYL